VGFGTDKGADGGAVAAAATSGFGGTITIKASNGALDIKNNSAIAANGGAGGNQSGMAGNGGNSTNGKGGDGGDVRQAGDGGNGGTITIVAANDPSPMSFTVKGGTGGAQKGTVGSGGKGKPSGNSGALGKPGTNGTNGKLIVNSEVVPILLL
jgi:hypothetical protein